MTDGSVNKTITGSNQVRLEILSRRPASIELLTNAKDYACEYREQSDRTGTTCDASSVFDNLMLDYPNGLADSIRKRIQITKSKLGLVQLNEKTYSATFRRGGGSIHGGRL